MLQQTQVATVVPYWERWMDRFPTVGDLAEADEQTLLSLWQGLGYYRRCRYLHRGARWVVDHGMPETADEWLRVPGVGRYTAAAIASISGGEPAAVVDGNVERVYARMRNDDAAGSVLHRRAWTWAQSVLDAASPGDWNQAVMELGATICRPSNPDCGRCPLQSDCLAFQYGTVGDLPTPTPTKESVRLNFRVEIPYRGGRFGVRQIPDGEWWQGMWEFLRTPGSAVPESGCESRRLGEVRHTVTHHRITLDVWLVHYEAYEPHLRWLDRYELEQLAMPAPQRKCLHLATEALANPPLQI